MSMSISTILQFGNDHLLDTDLIVDMAVGQLGEQLAQVRQHVPQARVRVLFVQVAAHLGEYVAQHKVTGLLQPTIDG